MSDPVAVFGQLIRILEREIDYQLKYGDCCDVSQAQCHALLELGSFESTTVSELTDILKLDKSTLSRTIEGLVQQDLVERRTNPDDRRFIRVALTPQGKKSFESITRLCSRIYQRVFDFIPADKQDQVLESMSLLVSAMIQANVGGATQSGNEACCTKRGV